MFSHNPRITVLSKLRELDSNIWLDYSKEIGFKDEDIPELINLCNEKNFATLDLDSIESRVGIHARRALIQLGGESSITTLVSSINKQSPDASMRNEFGRLFASIGSCAIEPLCRYLRQPGNRESCYIIAVEALYKIARAHPQCRGEVISVFRTYMGNPYRSFGKLNGFMIGRLLDLDAKTVLDDIRKLFDLATVETSYSGDLDEVETLLGMSESRSRAISRTKRRALLALRELRLLPPDKTVFDDSEFCYEIIDCYLMLYGSEKSINGESQLDGFFAAIASTPRPVSQSTWLAEICGVGMPSSALQNNADYKHFNLAVLSLYRRVVVNLKQGRYEPEFIYHTQHYESPPIVNEWCEGFIRGLELWESLSIDDDEKLQEWIQPMQRFGTDPGIQSLDSLSRAEITSIKNEITPNLLKIYQYFSDLDKVTHK